VTREHTEEELLLLRHTGARLHEILGMTAGGYRKAPDPLQAFVVNKGSLGREEKRITFLDTDEEALWKYIRDERARYDPLGRRHLADLDAQDPIFLTARHKPYSDAAFRYHWDRLMTQAQKRYQVCFTPHAIRHLFVTQHLVWIKEAAGDSREEQQRLKAGLVQIMGWHSRETMQIYDHTFSLQEAVSQLHAFQRRAESQALLRATDAPADPTPNAVIEEAEESDAFAQLWEDLA
jgi:integrase